MDSSNQTIGIVIPNSATSREGELFGSLTYYLRDLVETADQAGWTGCVFSLKDVLRQRGVVWAWTRSLNKWRRIFLPIPKVVHSRINAIHSEDVEILEWLERDRGTVFINDPNVDNITNDRWRLNQIFLTHPNLITKVHETSLIRDTSSLAQVVVPSNKLVIVSRFKKSQRVCVLVENQGEKIKLKIVDNQLKKEKIYRSLSKVFMVVKDILGEAISYTQPKLATVEGCPIVFRSIWQKKLVWQQVVSVVRVADKNDFAGPFITASTLDKFLDRFSEGLPLSTEAIVYKIGHLGRLAAELLDKRSRGIGELAVDIGFDITGEAFLFDASTLAAPLVFRKLQIPEIKKNFLRNTLDLASLLVQREAIVFSPSRSVEQTGRK